MDDLTPALAAKRGRYADRYLGRMRTSAALANLDQ